MSCLFSTEEMINGNPSGVTNSKDPVRRRTIKKLDTNRMAYIISEFIIVYLYMGIEFRSILNVEAGFHESVFICIT